MPSVYDVLLVRHGESEGNLEGRFAYRSWDPHLTERGRAQALALSRQLELAPIRHLVTSPLHRAQETLAPTAHRLGIAPTILEDLAEVNLGIWDGQQLKALEQSDDPSFEAWRRDPEANPPPGGERILTVGERVLDTLLRFLESHEPGLTVAATHADCLKGAFLVVSHAPGPSARSVIVPNCGQLMLRYLPQYKKWVMVLDQVFFAAPR